jgi:hypothetical protein
MLEKLINFLVEKIKPVAGKKRLKKQDWRMIGGPF